MICLITNISRVLVSGFDEINIRFNRINDFQQKFLLVVEVYALYFKKFITLTGVLEGL